MTSSSSLGSWISILRQKESQQKDTRKPTKEDTSKMASDGGNCFRRKKVSKEKKFCLPTRVAVAIFPPLHDVDVHDWLPRFGSFQLLAENKALASCSKNPAYETRRRRRMFLMVSFSEKFSGFLNLKRLFFQHVNRVQFEFSLSA